MFWSFLGHAFHGRFVFPNGSAWLTCVQKQTLRRVKYIDLFNNCIGSSEVVRMVTIHVLYVVPTVQSNVSSCLCVCEKSQSLILYSSHELSSW